MNLLLSPPVLVSLSFVTAFSIVFIVQPSIAKIALEKNFTSGDKNDSNGLPQLTLGGISLFLGISLPYLLCAGNMHTQTLYGNISAMIILLFSGILLDCRLRYKTIRIAAKIFAVFIIAVFTDTDSLSQKTEIPSPIIIAIQTALLCLLLYVYHEIALKFKKLVFALTLVATIAIAAALYAFSQFDSSILAFALAGSLSGVILYSVYCYKKHRPNPLIGHTGIYMIGLVFFISCLQLVIIF